MLEGLLMASGDLKRPQIVGASSPLDLTLERLQRRYLRGSGDYEDNCLSDALLTKAKRGRSKSQIAGLHRLTDISSLFPKSSESAAIHPNRKCYSKALRELFELVKNVDSIGKDVSHQDSIHQAWGKEVLHNNDDDDDDDEDEEDDRNAVKAQDSSTHIYTETDVTLPSYLAANTATSTDHSFEPSPVPMKTKPSSQKTSILKDEGLLPAHVNQIYDELLVIYHKLQQESAALHEFSLRLKKREQCLAEKETLLLRHQTAVTKIRGVEEEVHAKIQIIKEQHAAEVKQLSETLKEKVKENKRLKSSFDTLKDLNDSMKKQLNDVSEQNKKLEIQAKKLQARLENLQRKHAFLSVQKCKDSVSQAAQMVKPIKMEKTVIPSKMSKVPPNVHVYELVAGLTEWISDHQLRKLCPEEETKADTVFNLQSSFKSDLRDKCTVLLPVVAEQLQWMPLVNTKWHLPLIKFTYWSMRQLESGSQQSPMMATLRRIGEDFFKGTVIRATRDCSPEPSPETKTKSAAFFKSANLPLRLVSTLVVIKTINQGYLKAFLEACSNESFFRTCAVLLRDPKTDGHILEKLSILLQKLSKIKSNKKLFELHTIHLTLQEMQRTASHDQAFLIINLNSILFNLGCTKITGLTTSQ
ncbi:coiled-coil domain-containing protein 138 isoform X2 [Pleurodeles waltl]|uniref:coiled-coil domain-containing protein 138 isoform X2 n=1 Tax=Pleurodeles waltl TaxID=8319 RepID=UPI003709C171